jgi:hypothetical protein
MGEDGAGSDIDDRLERHRERRLEPFAITAAVTMVLHDLGSAYWTRHQ